MVPAVFVELNTEMSDCDAPKGYAYGQVMSTFGDWNPDGLPWKDQPLFLHVEKC